MYISIVKLRVNDIERAVDFYTKTLGWEKTMDVSMGDGEDMRWVTVAPAGGQASFTLSKEAPSSGQTGDASGVILEVDDVYETHQQLKTLGVEFTEEPRTEPWGGWAMFKDSEGNLHGVHSPVPARVGTN